MTTQTTAVPLQPGELVRVVNERCHYYGMTAIVDSPDKYMDTVVCVRLTSTGKLVSLHVSDLARVPDAAGSK